MSTPESKPTIAIYTDPLLDYSMTFVRAQAETLQRYSSFYVSPRALRPERLGIPDHRMCVINRTGSKLGRLKEIPFRRLGFDPLFFRRVQRFTPVLMHAHFGPAALTA